jgi:hypothetical protein
MNRLALRLARKRIEARRAPPWLIEIDGVATHDVAQRVTEAWKLAAARRRPFVVGKGVRVSRLDRRSALHV